jgi:hypothetical protein
MEPYYNRLLYNPDGQPRYRELGVDTLMPAGCRSMPHSNAWKDMVGKDPFRNKDNCAANALCMTFWPTGPVTHIQPGYMQEA